MPAAHSSNIAAVSIASASLAAGLGGEVLLATAHGLCPLEALRGEVVSVVTTAGVLPATVRCLGRHPALRVTLTPVQTTRTGHRPPGPARIRHELVIGAMHACPGVDGTTAAVAGALVQAHTASPLSRELLQLAPALWPGVRHGLVFGDGTRGYDHTQTGTSIFALRLCGAKATLLPLFQTEPYVISSPSSTNGDPVVTVRSALDHKALPPGTSLTYLRGFLAGWLAADGSHDRSAIVLATQDAQAASWLVQQAPLAGLLALSDRVSGVRTTNYGERANALHRVRLSPAASAWLVERVLPVGEVPLFAVELVGDPVITPPPALLLLAPGVAASALPRP